MIKIFKDNEKKIIDSTLVILSLMLIFGCKESKVVKLYLSLIQRTILLTQMVAGRQQLRAFSKGMDSKNRRNK